MWFVLQPLVSGCPFKLYSPVSDRSSRVAVTLTDLLIVPVYICLCLSVWLWHIGMYGRGASGVISKLLQLLFSCVKYCIGLVKVMLFVCEGGCILLE